MSTSEMILATGLFALLLAAFGALMYRVGYMAAINERERRIRCAREGRAP